MLGIVGNVGGKCAPEKDVGESIGNVFRESIGVGKWIVGHMMHLQQAFTGNASFCTFHMAYSMHNV